MQECVYVEAPNIFSNDFNLTSTNCYLYTCLFALFYVFKMAQLEPRTCPT